MRALIDADILVFRCGFAAERNQWFLDVPADKARDKIGTAGPEIFSYKADAQVRLDDLLPGIYTRVEGVDYQLWAERHLEPVEHALHNVKVAIEKSLKAVECTEFDCTLYLSGDNNYRYDIAKTRPYKGNRDAAHRPTHEHAIRDYMRSTWVTEVSEGNEADDELGIAQCKYGPYESVIITLDKDLDMIPGFKYNFSKDVRYDVTEEEAHYNFCKQLLMGDSVDNIPGIPKIGRKKAEGILDGVSQHDLLRTVVEAYASKCAREDWFEYLTEQAQLIWIQRQPGQVYTIPEEYNTLGIQEADTQPDLSMY